MHPHEVSAIPAVGPPESDDTSGDDPDTATLTVRRGAKALVSTDEHVLLVQERRDDGSTFWTLPGGGLEPGESLRDCLQREFVEELGCPVEVGSPVATCIYQHRTIPETVTLYSVFDAAPAASPEPNREEGIVDVRWQPPEDPPSATLNPFQRVLADAATRL